MYSFANADKFHIKGRGDVYTVRSPIKCDRDQEKMLNEFGSIVEINGDKFKPIGFECYCMAIPVQVNELIGIIVEPIGESE